MISVKGCPFCGSNAQREDDDYGEPRYCCGNEECPASEPWFTYTEWNVRTAQS